MDDELKQHLIAMEGRMNARMDSLEGRMNARMDSLEGRMNTRMEELDARIERVETNLLTEFHKWASPTDMRMRSHSATLRALDLELEALADRVKKIENGKGGN